MGRSKDFHEEERVVTVYRDVYAFIYMHDPIVPKLMRRSCWILHGGSDTLGVADRGPG